MIPRLNIKLSLKQIRCFVSGKSNFELPENVFAFDHSRSAIRMALNSLCLPENSKVGVMAYNCHTVMNAIFQEHYIPVFIDITDHMNIDLQDLKSKASELSALIVTHLFGIINNVEKIKRDFPHLLIIEDCAHAFPYGNIIGDFATYSIGQGKFPSIGDGGFLIVKNEAFLPKVQSLYFHVPEYSKLQNMNLLLHMGLKAILYSPLIYSSLTLPVLKKFVKHNDISASITSYKMSAGILRCFFDSIQHTPEHVSSQIQNAKSLKSSLIGMPNIGKILYGSNAFMLVVQTNDTSLLKHFFRKKHIEVDTHFHDCIKWAQNFGYIIGDCPCAERMVQQLIMVPTYQNIKL